MLNFIYMRKRNKSVDHYKLHEQITKGHARMFFFVNVQAHPKLLSQEKGTNSKVRIFRYWKIAMGVSVILLDDAAELCNGYT